MQLSAVTQIAMLWKSGRSTVDAHAAAPWLLRRVSTFVLATEDPSQALKIVGATSELRTPAYYEKGVSSLSFFQRCRLDQPVLTVLLTAPGPAWLLCGFADLSYPRALSPGHNTHRMHASTASTTRHVTPHPCCRVAAVLAQVDQQFPQDAGLGQQHAIRLVQAGERKEQPLQTAMGNSYPLIIRLEALTEKAAGEGKQLQQVGDCAMHTCGWRGGAASLGGACLPRGPVVTHKEDLQCLCFALCTYPGL